MAIGRSRRSHFLSISKNVGYSGSGELNRWAFASVLSVEGRLPAGRGAGTAVCARGVREPGDMTPRTVALHANPWLPFHVVPRGRGPGRAGARTGGRMRQRA